jgi:hypothetical protein
LSSGSTVESLQKNEELVWRHFTLFNKSKTVFLNSKELLDLSQKQKERKTKRQTLFNVPLKGEVPYTSKARRQRQYKWYGLGIFHTLHVARMGAGSSFCPQSRYYLPQFPIVICNYKAFSHSFHSAKLKKLCTMRPIKKN